MKWYEFSILTTQEAVEPVSNVLHEHGASGVVIEDPHDLMKVWDTSLGELYELNPDDYPKEGVIIKAYFSDSPEWNTKLQTLKETIAHLETFGINLGKQEIQVHEVDDENWATAWKKYYKPVKVTNAITIVPTWEEYEPEEDELIIELDPGMAFGTGTHPTTVMCMRAIEKYLLPSQTVIDVGTGSGVLSITAAKLGAKEVFAFDLDDVAVQSASTNIALNNVDDLVIVQQNNLLEGIEIKADLIVGNLLAEIVELLIPDAWKRLNEEGIFISSGIIQTKAEHIKEQLTTTGFTIVETFEMDDWAAIVAKK